LPSDAEGERRTVGPGPVIMLDGDFRPPSNNSSAPPYLLLPETWVSFAYWHEEQKRYANGIIPPQAWKLARCRGAQ
jgi:hypothetical protein